MYHPFLDFFTPRVNKLGATMPQGNYETSKGTKTSNVDTHHPLDNTGAHQTLQT